MVKTITIRQLDGTCVALEFWDSKEIVTGPRIYMTKKLNDGTIHAFDRAYRFLGVVQFAAHHESKWALLYNHKAKIQVWDAYLGPDNLEGDAIWFDLASIHPVK